MRRPRIYWTYDLRLALHVHVLERLLLPMLVECCVWCAIYEIPISSFGHMEQIDIDGTFMRRWQHSKIEGVSFQRFAPLHTIEDLQ